MPDPTIKPTPIQVQRSGMSSNSTKPMNRAKTIRVYRNGAMAEISPIRIADVRVQSAAETDKTIRSREVDGPEESEPGNRLGVDLVEVGVVLHLSGIAEK